MNHYDQNMQEELAYLDQTINIIKHELDREKNLLAERKNSLITSRKDLWDNTVLYSGEFDRMAEANQYLTEVNNQTANYFYTQKQMEKYHKMLHTPYFGRFDFVEDGSTHREKIYVGVATLTDGETGRMIVCDWRAPISSIFYQYETGLASYHAPSGNISGDVLLKRQYKIKNSQLKYFFDCSIQINDEILQSILGQNSSPKMRNIVESIQKEQDLIIRDMENQLLIVQGVAGSGKTSVALHKVAFLLYQGLNCRLNSTEIVIISPNLMFSKYISGVLPELGEENVRQFTFEEYASGILDKEAAVEKRNEWLEGLLTAKDTQLPKLRQEMMEFKGSECFMEIINRLLFYFEHNQVVFEDIWYDGKIIFTRQELRNIFLNRNNELPVTVKLRRIEQRVFDKIHDLHKARLEKIEKLTATMEGHQLEIKSFSRLLSIKETKKIKARLDKFLKADYFQMYYFLFSRQEVFAELSAGLELPANWKEMIEITADNLKNKKIAYEDCAPLLYLKMKLEGVNTFLDIKHVVIDEAQDYSPIQYELFRQLFPSASFTVLGDVNQSIEKDVDQTLYDQIVNTFGKKQWLKVTLNKGYRSSFEITRFANHILGSVQTMDAVERHENPPEIFPAVCQEDIDAEIISKTKTFLEQGYETIAVLGKTSAEAGQIFKRLKDRVQVKLVVENDGELQKGVTIMPAYLSKGLEFDAVFIYDAGAANYHNELDRKLLYIASTRALHRLVVCYSGEKSPFIDRYAVD